MYMPHIKFQDSSISGSWVSQLPYIVCSDKIRLDEAILISTHNIPFLNIKKKIVLNYPKSATIEFVPRDPRPSLNQPW